MTWVWRYVVRVECDRPGCASWHDVAQDEPLSPAEVVDGIRWHGWTYSNLDGSTYCRLHPHPPE